jgi:hypothetical protein
MVLERPRLTGRVGGPSSSSSEESAKRLLNAGRGSSSSLESPKRLAFEVLTGFFPFERPKRRSRDVLPSLESPLLSDGLIRLPIEGGGGDVVEPRRNGVGERDRKLNLLLRFICSAAAGL